jgi:FKBP-type peptidyl-prolyl cis-trans isomerase FkpA
MPRSVRALCALLLALAAATAFGQQASLDSERAKIGYMIGMDVAHSVAPAVPDMDMAAFRRALENALAGGKPLLDADRARRTSQALMASIGARGAGKPAAAVDRADVGLLVGADVGRSLASIRGEFDVPVFLQGFRDGSDPKAKPLLDPAEADRLRVAFSARQQQVEQARAAARGAKNREAGEAFLAKNKTVKGVFTTPSGLQYMILRQGNGPRPLPGQRVRVNYEGKLLDGTVFDSSYRRGQPAEFSLDQVIAGWREGVGMMPVGGKYRFWIPGAIGYGEEGTPDGSFGPNATLVFDVELLGVQ